VCIGLYSLTHSHYWQSVGMSVSLSVCLCECRFVRNFDAKYLGNCDLGVRVQ